MFYLIRAGDQRTIAEDYSRAVALVARGWELTTRERYMALWMIADADRLHELKQAAQRAPLLEQHVGGHYV